MESFELKRRRDHWRKRAERAELPFADLSILKGDPRAIALVSRATAERHGVLPLEERDGVLYVATSCVSSDLEMERSGADSHGTFMCSSRCGDMQAAEAIREVAMLRVRFLLASPADIRAGIERDYAAAEV